MLYSTHQHPFAEFLLVGPSMPGVDTPPHLPIATQPSTPIPAESAAVDLTPSHTEIAHTPAPSSLEPNPSCHTMVLYLSPEVGRMWDQTLQVVLRALREDNGGLHAWDYHTVHAISPFYRKIPTHLGVWIIISPGSIRRGFPSDETRLKSGVALHLEDDMICAHLLTEVFPTNLIRLGKPIRHDRGYVIYEFTSDLFSRFCIPWPETAPTNLIAIPEYHTDSEAAHLRVQEATLHQRIQEEDYTLPPLHTWEDDPCIYPPPPK